MALSGTHVTCGYVGGRTGPSIRVSLSGKAVWSQTMPTAGVTTQAAPAATAERGDPCFEVRPTADIFVAIGPNPDATNGPRYFLASADGARNLLADEGDKLAWILA